MPLTLSSAFQLYQALGDELIVLAQLDYDDSTAFLPLSTAPHTITEATRTRQYLGCIISSIGSRAEWRLAEGGGVTRSAPELVLANKQAYDGWSLADEFSAKQFFGRQCRLYLGYGRMLDLDDWLLLATATIEDLDFDQQAGTLTVRLEAMQFPEVEAAGRAFDDLSYADMSGTPSYLPAAIDAKATGKRIPAVFGDNWAGPLVYYGDLETSGGAFAWTFATLDSAYLASGLDLTPGTVNPTLYQPNIAQAVQGVFVADDGQLVPYHRISIAGNDNTHFQSATDGTHDLMTFAVYRAESSDQTKRDESVFLVIPMRLFFVDSDTDGTFVSTPTEANLREIFDLDSTEVTWEYSGGVSTRAKVRLSLSLPRNLRVDWQGVPRPSRLSHIVSSQTIPMMNLGRIGLTVGGNFIQFNYLNNGAPSVTGAPPGSDIGAWTAAERANFIGFGIAFAGGETEYNQNDKGAGDWSADGDFDPIDFATPGYHVANAAVFDEESEIANAENIRRTELEKSVQVFWYATPISAGDSCTVSLYAVYYAAAGTVETPLDEPSFFLSSRGFHLTAGSTLTSIGAGSNVQLKRPYEYIELMLRGRAGAATADLASEWSGLSTAWVAMFAAAMRDYSGFALIESIGLPEFMAAYQAFEPFACYIDEAGLYRFRMLKNTYAHGDVTDGLDFRDADGGFRFELTPKEWLCAEIEHLKTDFVHGIDAYCLDLHWRLPAGTSAGLYDYTKWDKNNAAASDAAGNRFKRAELAKPYTTGPRCSRLRTGSDPYQYWGCIKTYTSAGTPVAPDSDTEHWMEIVDAGSISTDVTGAIAGDTMYYGEDAESFGLARWWLNMFANRRMLVTFNTSRMSYAKYTVGDVIQLTNVPYKPLIAAPLKGWNGNTDNGAFSINVNNQAFYSAFVVISVAKGTDGIEIRCLQLCDLAAYTPARVN